MTGTQWIVVALLFAACCCVMWWQAKHVPNVTKRIERDRVEAEALAHTHLMQAEHHQALALMYQKRAVRLGGSRFEVVTDHQPPSAPPRPPQ